MKPIDDLFNMLWKDYSQLNPIANQIHSLLRSKGEEVLNDHVAFRTYQHPKIGLSVLARPFLELGYQKKGEYVFEQKKLYAEHYEHSQPNAPKVFISELKLNECSEKLRKKVLSYIDEIPESKTKDPKFLISGRQWSASHSDYLWLSDESEYAGWMAAFGFRPNHFTVNVNHLKSFQDIPDLNQFLKQSGFTLNSSGGEVKGGAEVYLAQSSTLANRIKTSFSDGTFEIPACYYEFAKRYPLPSGELYQGFVEKSADKIFESTHRQ